MAKRTRLTAMEVYATKSRKAEPVGSRGSGTLQFERKASGAIVAFYRERKGTTEARLTLGVLSKTPTPETNERDLNGMRAEAARVATEAANVGGLASFLELQKEQLELAAKERKARQRAAELMQRRGTFAEMLEAYVQHLEATKKPSAGKVRSLFRVNVLERQVALAARYADEIEAEDIKHILDDVLRRPPKGRGIGNKAQAKSCAMYSTADELRRYLRTAFNHAAAIHLMPGKPTEVSHKSFRIAANPAAMIPSISGANGGSTPSLTPAELGELLRYLDALPKRHAAIANSLIYLGAQRIIQLLAVTWDRVDEETLCLLDFKGRKVVAWEHLLPLTPRILEIMSPLLEEAGKHGPFCFSPDKPAHEDTVSHLFSEAGRVLSESGKTRSFSWKEVRATTETLLAAQGVSEETRAWLLSHGRQGVQAKHYNRYSYLPEKRIALELWGHYLDRLKRGEPGENVRLKRERKA